MNDASNSITRIAQSIADYDRTQDQFWKNVAADLSEIVRRRAEAKQ